VAPAGRGNAENKALTPTVNQTYMKNDMGLLRRKWIWFAVGLPILIAACVSPRKALDQPES